MFLNDSSPLVGRKLRDSSIRQEYDLILQAGFAAVQGQGKEGPEFVRVRPSRRHCSRVRKRAKASTLICR